jgi:Fic family protein
MDKNNQPFTYWIPDCLHRGISEVDKWSGGQIITDQPYSLPAKEKYIINSLMDEAIASSQLEGALTEYRIAKEMLRSGRKPKDKNEQMIFNNWNAMQFIRENSRKPFSIDKLYELHTILTQETLKSLNEAGKFREKDDVYVIYRDETVHVPPKADTLKERIDRLVEFANNDDEENWVHPVIKGAMIHFWLAYDHPFSDGNGRTARALMYWYLLSRGYELFQYLSISKHFLHFLFLQTLKKYKNNIVDYGQYIKLKYAIPSAGFCQS